ncbi:uncharacterized protein LOC141899510 isoform X2 [Tubulanus polymorphus]|uniref:uncharacterized protein LOC141899510 isoform X2 n=1 Tax=Tubulanus polymorphus TaxID=672921 RepID=UPI003DA49DCA
MSDIQKLNTTDPSPATFLDMMNNPSCMSRAGVVLGLDVSALPPPKRRVIQTNEAPPSHRRRNSYSGSHSSTPSPHRSPLKILHLSPEHLLQNHGDFHRRHPMMNADISREDFVKAINFDQLQNLKNSSPSKKHEFLPYTSPRKVASVCGDSEHIVSSHFQRTTSMEMLDQQQKVEQARLLERFKMMREIQRQEQERLMKQQEQQLELLRLEQERAHYLLLKQREESWNKAGYTGSPHHSPQKPSHFTSPQRHRSPTKLYGHMTSPNHHIYPSVMMHRELEDMENDAETMMQAYGRSRILTGLAQPQLATEQINQFIEDESDIDKIDEEQESVELPMEKENGLDDKPVAGTVKTFEQLLEEQLKLEEERVKNVGSSETSKTKYTPTQKRFLKKGQGIARFNQPILKRPVPTRRKNSQSMKTNQIVIDKKPTTTENDKKTVKSAQIALKPTITTAESTTKPADWNIENKDEIDELEEFELLEQYADHPSFQSDASFVQRVIAPKSASEQNKQEQEMTAFQKYLESKDLHGESDIEESESDESSDDEAVQTDDLNPVFQPDEHRVLPTCLQRKVATKQGNNNQQVLQIVDKEVMNGEKDDAVDDEDGDEKDSFVDAVCDDENNENEADEFDDEDEWGDFNNDESLVFKNGPMDVSTPVENQQIGLLINENDNKIPDSPPTSTLMTKLFPKLKPPKPKPTPEENKIQQKLEAARQPNPPVDGAMSKALRDKLMELENEIERFQTENACLIKLKKEREEGLEKLKKEMAEFEKQKDEELKNLHEFKEQEMKKIKKERKLFEKYQKESRAIPDKRDREEIETLRLQLADLQEEMKRKESRWTSNSNRQRNRIEQLEQETVELRDEIRILEKKRLELWQKQENIKNDKSEIPVLKKLESSTGSNESKLHKPTNSNIRLTLQKPNSTTSQKPAQTTLQKPVQTMTTSLAVINGKPPSVVVTKQLTRVKTAAPTREQILRGSVEMEDRDDSDGDDAEAEEVPRTNISLMNSCSGTQLNLPDSLKIIERKTIPRKCQTHFSLDTACIDKGDLQFEEVRHKDGKRERIYSNGAREIIFVNGTRKEISPDGQSVIVSFFNGDIKQVMPDKRVVYYYADAQTTHTTYPDQLEILQFPNNQIEKHYPDGTREITFPDHTMKYLFPNGAEESIFGDGTVIRVEANGDKTMEFPNGQREIHCQSYKRREYPDGTVKTVYPDGRQETRYSGGRLRVKDKDGTVIVDRRC